MAFHHGEFGTPPSRRFAGLSAVVVLHLALGYALVTGLARKVIEVVQAPIQVDLVEPPERELPPPLPPPVEAPEYEPPPSFVPPPEVRVKPPPAPPPVITTTPVAPPPAPVRLAPPPAPAPAAPVPAPPPAPPKPPPDLSRPARLDVSRCEQPQYPAAARRDNATGTSRIRFQVDAAGRVVASEVIKRSGFTRAHRLLDRAAVQALGGCRFEPGRDRQGRPVGGFATVEYVWRLE